MALGALLKVKMDSTAVARGLRTIRAGFGRLSSAIGRLRGAWGKLKGSAIGAVFGAIAQQVANTAKWMAVLRDEMATTGQSAKDILAIREALEFSGVDPGQAGNMVNEMQKRLAEAARPGGGGEAAEGLDILGLHVRDVFHMKGARAFEHIMKKVKDSDKDTKFLIKALDSIFGGEGMKIHGLAKDFDERMATARENVEGLADAFGGKGVEGVTKMQIRIAKFRNTMRQFWMEMIGAIPFGLVQELLKAVAEALPKIITSLTAFFKDPMGHGSWLRAIADWFEDIFIKLMKDLKNWALNLKNDFLEMVRPIAAKFGKDVGGAGWYGEGKNRQDLLPGLIGPKFDPKREGKADKMIEEQKKSNDHLRDIARRKAVWA